jgi:hypothetical protein
MSRDILVPAHGTAAKGGAELVAEATTLKDMGPVNAARTADGLALASRRGRPFRPGNAAGANRGSSLTRIGRDGGVPCDPDAPDERRRARRKAATLARVRRCELEIQMGGPVSSAVRVELVGWARATAWAELYDRAGDGVRSVAFAEKASGHGLKALGIAEREAAGRPRPPALRPWEPTDADLEAAEAKVQAEREAEAAEEAAVGRTRVGE